MILDKLSCKQFHAVVIAGCQRVIDNKILLNEINVFPVADGDTGDNLSSTSHSIIEFSTVKPDLLDTIISIADASIIGARGNSGIIFSQFFNLLANYIPRVEYLTFRDFSQALVRISQEIADVVSKAITGTMITLIQKFAYYAESKKEYDSFSQAMLEIIPLLFLDVEKTKDTLSILKQANVVDAGALGFYYFVEGAAEFLQDTSTIPAVKKISHLAPMNHVALSDNPPEFRYCTEAIIKAAGLNKSELLTYLKKQGDCSSLIGNGRASRLHVHTNNPRELFTTLYKKYQIQYPKVDDMRRQYELQFSRKYKIALVTDSSADLPSNLIDEYQIYQIYLNIQVDDHQLLDKYSFDPAYFYKQLIHFKTYPKTSCLNANLIEEKLNNIAKQYDHVVILSVSSQMSGMYEAFIKASKKYKNVSVLDTKTNSGAHGLLLHYAGQLIASGENIQNIIYLVKKAIENTCIFVMVSQFDSMIRSGRINKLSGKIAKWTNLKPIVSIDSEGRGIVVSKCFSTIRARNKLVTLLERKLNNTRSQLEDYCIVHADESNEADLLAQTTQAVFNRPPLFIESVSLAIGLHAGRGCIALAARISD